ncbi:CSTOS protein, partial [Pomatorhinus ruficollis]|nr:CSTOS protein [Pomatorhinus ruficollis]
AGPDSDSGSDSDSGGEAAARFREAAWDCTAQAAAAAWTEPRGEGQTLLASKELILVLISNGRESIGLEEGDNELQTTPEFRAHVAKKLGTMLDSFITVSKDSSGPSQTLEAQSDSEDDGFRLFSSSVPGDCGKPEPCPARRRRPVSSSDTDSDQEWQRYQEAAVSAADILKQSAFPALSQPSSQDQSQAYVEPKQKKKKKKK